MLGDERFGLVEVVVLSVVVNWLMVFFPETRGFARGRCLYATKSFSAAGSGIKSRPSCLITRGCLPSSFIHAVCGE